MTLLEYAEKRAGFWSAVRHAMPSKRKAVNTGASWLGLRTQADEEADKIWGRNRENGPGLAIRNRLRLEREKMINARNYYADQGLGVNASTMSPTHIFSRISRAAQLHGNGSIGNLTWRQLLGAGVGDNALLDRNLVKPAAEKEPEEKPLDFGFKPPRRVPLEDAHKAWSGSKRTPADNVKFLDAMEPVVNQSLKMYANGVDAPYLRSKARLLALDAAGKWDPSKARINTFLLSQMQPLRRAVAKSVSDIKVPEAVQYDAVRLRTTENELREELDRDPTDDELSDRMHIPMKQLSRLRRVVRPNKWQGSLLEADDQPAVADTASDDMWADFVYHDLGVADKLIFESRTGYNGKPVIGVTEVARKLGISPGMVSRRAEAIAKMLNSRPKGW